jgi:hypothetical protein
MPDYTARKKLKITAGAVASLVIVGWAVVLAIAFCLGAMQRKKPPQKPLDDMLRRQKRLCH